MTSRCNHCFIPVLGNNVPVPIVPLSEENEDTMEDAVFLSFLTKIGLAAPADENVSVVLRYCLANTGFPRFLENRGKSRDFKSTVSGPGKVRDLVQNGQKNGKHPGNSFNPEFSLPVNAKRE